MAKPLSVLLVAAALVAVAGCQKGMDLPNKIAVAKTHNLAGLQPLNRYEVVVRTYSTDSTGKSAEVSGMTCKLRSSELSARVVTPQKLSLPEFATGARFKGGGKPSALRVSCSGSGKTGAKTVAPINNFSIRTHTDQTASTSTLDLGVSATRPWIYPSIIRVDVQ